MDGSCDGVDNSKDNKNVEGEATHAFVTREPADVQEQQTTAAIARPMPVVARRLSYSNFSHLNEQA